MNFDVLFLDLDGVLNNNEFFAKQRANPKEYIHKKFCSGNIEVLEKLCSDFKVKEIVITSTWRMGRSVQDLRDMLAKDGFKLANLITDKTDEIGGPGGRAEEIKSWMDIHKPNSHIVLDDNPIGDTTGLNFHRVHSSYGLTNDDLQKISEISI